MEITEISKIFKTGEMDVKTKGKKVFRILEIINEIPEKLYSGAIVSYPHNHEHGKRFLMNKVIATIKELHKLLKVNKAFTKKLKQFCGVMMLLILSGLRLRKNMNCLTFMNELHRQEYLKRHLAKVIPVVAEMEAERKNKIERTF